MFVRSSTKSCAPLGLSLVVVAMTCTDVFFLFLKIVCRKTVAACQTPRSTPFTSNKAVPREDKE